jgi:putative transposase
MRAFRHRRWHLDEVFVKINGIRHYLWRAVDHEGEGLESFVTKTCDRKGALNFLRKSVRRHGPPEAIVTDGPASYGAALKTLTGSDQRIVGRWLNNRHCQRKRSEALISAPLNLKRPKNIAL